MVCSFCEGTDFEERIIWVNGKEQLSKRCIKCGYLIYDKVKKNANDNLCGISTGNKTSSNNKSGRSNKDNE